MIRLRACSGFSTGTFLSKDFLLLLLLLLLVVVVGSFLLLSSLILGLGSLPLPPPPPNSDFALLVDHCCCLIGATTLSLSLFLSFPLVVKQSGGCMGSDESNFLLFSPVCFKVSKNEYLLKL
jgi:hypothetical protein